MTTNDLKGRTFLITGANTGIGRVTAEVIAKRGGRVFLACRSEAKTKPVIDAIRAEGGDAEFLQLDLGDLSSVRACATAFLDRNEPLHVLINNAGLTGRGLTKDGFEITFGTNHLGHFLLTLLLLPRLRESTPARIVNVSSGSHYRAKHIDWDALRKPTKSVSGVPEYELSKLCNVLFTKELARGRAGKGVTSYSLHPGVIASDIWRRVPFFIRPFMKMLMKSTEEGARTSIHCATSPEVADQDGLYYNDDTREKRPSKVSQDPELAKQLWEKSAEWVGLGPESSTSSKAVDA